MLQCLENARPDIQNHFNQLQELLWRSGNRYQRAICLVLSFVVVSNEKALWGRMDQVKVH